MPVWAGPSIARVVWVSTDFDRWVNWNSLIYRKKGGVFDWFLDFFKKELSFITSYQNVFFCKGCLISILTQSYSISIVFNSSRSLVMMKIYFSLYLSLKYLYFLQNFVVVFHRKYGFLIKILALKRFLSD